MKGHTIMSDTPIKYNDHSILSAFKDHYIVPDYQREYVWDDGQVEQLLNDLFEAYNSDNQKTYFLGTIVTYNSGSCFELIDGQQRLTTFFIMLCAIKEMYGKNGVPTKIIEDLIYSPVMNSDGDTINSYHLQLQYEDAENYLETIEKSAERPSNLTQSGERMFDALKNIQTSLNEKFTDFSELKKFVYFLLNKTSFIRIETHDITDALKIFETINQRGKGLDPMDLLKNMVFRQVDRKKFKELNMNWRAITRELEKIDEKPLRFLRYFIMANYDTSDEKDEILREDQIYTWLSKNNAQCHYVEEPFKFVQKMNDNVEMYVKYRMPTDNDNGNIHLKNIPMLAGKAYKLHLMLMLAASNMNGEALVKFKYILESAVYYAVINRIATNVTEKTFASWCKYVRNVKTVDELDTFVKDKIVTTINEWKRDNESNFMRLGLNSMQQYRVKFILAKITAYVHALRSSETSVGELAEYTKSTVEIEHIMPKGCQDKTTYGIGEDEFNIYINRLGNLTLLENTLNKSIKDSLYSEKVKAYKQSKFYLTSSLPELVNHGKDTAINRTNKLLRSWSNWNKNAIDERQKMLYELSEIIWSIK